MVDVVRQLCIKSYVIEARNGDRFEAKQGKDYTTTVPQSDRDTVIVFSRFWVPVPKDHFVLMENESDG